MNSSSQSAALRIAFEPSEDLPQTSRPGPETATAQKAATTPLATVKRLRAVPPAATQTDHAVQRLSVALVDGVRKRGWLLFQFVVFPLAVLALWWFVSEREILPSNILPGPVAVVRAFLSLLANGDLATHLGVSLWRVARGAALGLSIGLVLGLALGVSPAVESWIGPSFRVLVQIPSIALIPLLMMVLGIDDSLKLFIMAKACVIPLALVTSDGIRNIPKSYLEVGRVLKLSQRTLYLRLVLPGALPAIFTGIRQGVAHVWVSLVAVEVMASADGMGYLMTWSRQIFQLDVVLVCVVVIGAIGFTLDFGLRKTESYFLRWREKSA